jgi:hypothetical protein
MASAVKFQDFIEQLCLGVHNLHTGAFKVYPCENTPSVSLDAVKADLAGIAYTNLTPGNDIDIDNSFSESGGTGTMVTAVDPVWTASGAVAQFRYIVCYNDTPTSPADPLFVYWDYGSEINMISGETFTVDFGANIATFS